MSNYYYEEKTSYLTALADSRRLDHDLTAFMLFALKGVALQSRRLLSEIQHEISRELFRNLMFDLFNRLTTPRKRVIAQRQLEILKILLAEEKMEWPDLTRRVLPLYRVKNPLKALVRDFDNLIAMRVTWAQKSAGGQFTVGVRLQWPMEVTETDFFEQLKKLPKARTHSFLQQ